MSNRDLAIGFIGGGNMARAMISGLVSAGHHPARIQVSEPGPSQRELLLSISAELQCVDDNVHVATQAEILVLAVKPQILGDIASGLGRVRRPARQCLMSIAAGIPLSRLAKWFGPTQAVIRVMPNQPMMHGAGMSVLVANEAAKASQRDSAEYVAKAAGATAWIEDEALMDAVTAVSGSGPAYFYLVMEMMLDCATEMGLDPDFAEQLVRQTALGAAITANESSLELPSLRKMVTSKGGTTHAALTAMEDSGIRDIFRRALTAARDRSIELGETD